MHTNAANHLLRWLASGAVLYGLACVLSCGGGDDGPIEPTPDPAGAAARVLQANAALERELFRILQRDFDPQRPGDVDFREANRLYGEALDLDGANLDAHFGVGVTNLAALSNDTEVNAAFDEWKDFLQNGVPFDVPGKPGQPLGVPLGFMDGPRALELPFDIVPMSLLATGGAMMLRQPDPQIGRVQAILRERVLPELTQTLAHLQMVAADQRYTFTVTPRMQGDDEAEPAEIDQTDILALRAACSLLASACHISISYNLGLAAYDSTNLHQALLPGSGWLTLATDGALHLRVAHAAMLAAVDDLEDALTALENETDNQDDDVIKIGPDVLSQRDFDTLQDEHLPNVRRALTRGQGYTRVDDWDRNNSTPDVALRIDIGEFLQDPVGDWKALLPAYTATLERRVDGCDNYLYESGVDTVAVVLTSEGYGAWYYFYDSDENMPNVSTYGSPEFVDALRGVFQNRELPACLNWLNFTANLDGFLPAGTHEIPVSWNLQACSGTCVVVPVITWAALDFPGWTWPDPTLNGLLANMTSSSQALQTFGVHAEDWERRWVLDWTDAF